MSSATAAAGAATPTMAPIGPNSAPMTRPRAWANRCSIATSSKSARAVTCGLTVAGIAMCWGSYSEALGQPDTDDGSRPAPIMGSLRFNAISVGFSHVCGLSTSGAVYCWGDNRYGQLGDGEKAAHLTPGLVPIPP